ncbi:DUF1510 family protein [Gottfriedia acidiceleris]|uniref:DUF1510 family protein n=1 Tax=Gottfriedia acidiceleris TaxID=371036 RepID=UPI001F175B41|nr:DUF1510 family protein [Gottfriedia acidiceleris]
MKKIQSNSRTTSRAKRKKTKLILFGSIGIVLILIAFVSYSIFSPNDNKAGSKKSAYASAKNSEKNDDNGVKETSTTVQTIDDEDSDGSAPEQTGAQTGAKHVTSYDRNSQDWQAMLQTISSAAGIDSGNMTVWFLGSDKSNPGGSVGTVSAKTKGSQKYRVYLIWDGSSYKATKVEPAS